ncbi:MAG TPA: hypothetical protein ENN46_03305 [Candidatus Woesearchaeota archaeon]|nr:hypothetical protein [Candidatus Woesearchaeota archaeon]
MPENYELQSLMSTIAFKRSQGSSDYQIVQELIAQGHKTSVIYDAINQLDLKQAIASPVSPKQDNQEPSPQQPSFPASSTNEPAREPVNRPPVRPAQVNQEVPFESREQEVDAQSPYQNEQQEQEAPEEAMPQGELGEQMMERIQEISEAIIEEKWDELIRNVQKIVKWKDRVEVRIGEIENKMAAVEDEVSKIYKSLFSKMEEYDSHIQEFGTDIKAMQQVFKELLPQFVSGVHQMNDVLSGIKGTQKKEPRSSCVRDELHSKESDEKNQD